MVLYGSYTININEKARKARKAIVRDRKEFTKKWFEFGETQNIVVANFQVF